MPNTTFIIHDRGDDMDWYVDRILKDLGYTFTVDRSLSSDIYTNAGDQYCAYCFTILNEKWDSSSILALRALAFEERREDLKAERELEQWFLDNE